MFENNLLEEDKDKKLEDKSKDDFDKSKLPTNVKNLIQLIFDLKMMNKQMKEIGYDAKKMPLGKLSKTNIEKGYKILSEIADCIKQNKSNKKDTIEKLSSDFYSFIPHDFGFQFFNLEAYLNINFLLFRKMYNFILDSEKKVKEKLDMLQSISDIQIATRLLEDASKSDNLIDDHYQKLKCTMIPLDHSVPIHLILFNQSLHKSPMNSKLSANTPKTPMQPPIPPTPWRSSTYSLSSVRGSTRPTSPTVKTFLTKCFYGTGRV